METRYIDIPKSGLTRVHYTLITKNKMIKKKKKKSFHYSLSELEQYYICQVECEIIW